MINNSGVDLLVDEIQNSLPSNFFVGVTWLLQLQALQPNKVLYSWGMLAQIAQNHE